MIRPKEKYPIAVDTDGRELFAVQLADHPDRICIKGIFREKLTTGPDAGAAAKTGLNGSGLDGTLKRLKKTKGFSGRRVILHLPMEKVLSFPVDLEAGSEQNLEWAILAKLEKSLPYSLDDAVVDYPSIFRSGPSGEKTAIITAARRQDVLDLILPFKKAGFLVDAVDFSPLSLRRLHVFLEKSSRTPDLICHIGRRGSSLQVIARNRIYALSKFNWGRDSLVDRLNRALDFDPAGSHASDLIETYGLEESGTGGQDARVAGSVSRILSPAMEELVFEFHKVLGYARAREQFQSLGRVYFYGLGSKVRGLFQYIEQRLHLPAAQGHIKAHIVWKGDPLQLNEEDRAVFNPVIGLAMRRVPWR